MADEQPLCLALGMGAIGKAVSGYAMVKAGVHVTFADIAQAQINAVNQNGGYWLGTADIYAKQATKAFITGVDAVHVETPQAQRAAMEAEYIISAVGPRGFRALLPRVIGWLQERNRNSDRPLYYMVFENDNEALHLLEAEVDRVFHGCPDWLHIAKCSIERMTKVVELEGYGATAIGETFFPIIADEKAMRGCSIYHCADVIEMVEDVQKYYYRKLLTNNLGHAVLGYAGQPRGYANTLEAMADPAVYALLRQTLREAGEVLCAHWGFTREHMEKHIETLMLRFGNPGLIDDLERLTRDPIRKISPEERIVLPIVLAYRYGIEPKGLLRTLACAISYCNRNVERGQELMDLRAQNGDAWILQNICKADGRFLEEALQTINIPFMEE